VHSFGRKRPPFTPNQASWHEADEQKDMVRKGSPTID